MNITLNLRQINNQCSKLNKQLNDQMLTKYFRLSILFIYSQLMSFLRNFFSNTHKSSTSKAVQSVFKTLRINSDEPLPDNYYQLLFAPSIPHGSAYQTLSQIINYLSNTTSEASIVKLYTIIMSAIRISNYDQQLCELLENLPQKYKGRLQQQKPKRVSELQTSCKSYLIKISMMSQLYRSAVCEKQCESDNINLYRLINQYSLLFPYLNIIINTVGRYYKENCLYYKEFYRIWRSQILLGYLAMKKQIDEMISNYRMKDKHVLQSFLQSVTQIQLLCDQMEAFITNKYYRGKSPNKKILFKQEFLKEIQYYQATYSLSNGKINEDFVKTSEDDYFQGQPF